MKTISPHLLKLPAPGEYAKAWRKLLTIPDRCEVKWDWTGPRTAKTLRRDFSQALQHRINSRGGEEWRNELTQEEIDWRRDQRDLHAKTQHRIRVYQFRTELVRDMFGHLLDSYNEA